MSNSPSPSPTKKEPKKIEETKETEEIKGTNGVGESKEKAAKKIEEKEKKIEEKKEKKKTPSIPSLYWRLGVVFILGPVLIGGIFFTSNKLKALAEEVEQKRGQFIALSEREESFKNISSDLVSVEEEIALIEKALPNEKEIIELLNEIRKIEEEAGVEIAALGFESDQPRIDESGRSYIELAVEASGPVASLEKFFKDILDLPLLMKVKTIDAVEIDEGTSELAFRAWLYVDPDFFLEK